MYSGLKVNIFPKELLDSETQSQAALNPSSSLILCCYGRQKKHIVYCFSLDFAKKKQFDAKFLPISCFNPGKRRAQQQIRFQTYNTNKNIYYYDVIRKIEYNMSFYQHCSHIVE